MSNKSGNLTRRDFLKGLGLIAGVTAIGPIVFGSTGLALADYAINDPYVYEVFDYVKLRAAGLYNSDGSTAIRCSYDNPEIITLYDEFLGQPLSEKAEQLLHTTYINRMG